MLITLNNGQIALTADTLGAQLKSLKSADGVEYLWQADPAYWGKHAPNLFPFIARLTEGSYTYKGKRYSMPNHGFAAKYEYSCEHGDTRAVFSLKPNAEIKEMYPFSFIFSVIYELCDNTLNITYRVENTGDERMYFGAGGHPGFCVPLEEGLSFQDYSLVFSQKCYPDRVGFTPAPEVLLSGIDERYPLKDDREMPLYHDMFDDDAVILKNMAREVTLCSQKGRRGLKVSYPDMSYLGIWHKPQTDAPYVCIEPWTTLPCRAGAIEEISAKSDMVALCGGKVYENTWSVTLF